MRDDAGKLDCGSGIEIKETQMNRTYYPRCGHGEAAQVPALGCAACLSNQRDELLDALKDIVSEADDHGAAFAQNSPAMLAIAKIEGSADLCR